MTHSVVLCSAGYDHKIYFWEPPSGACHRSLKFPDSQVNCLRITPDKQFLSAAGNPHVRIFEINSQNPSPIVAYDGHTSNVTDMGFQKDGKWMYTGSEDGSIKIWDLRAQGCQRNYEAKAPVNTVALHPNQAELISGDQHGKIQVWDLTASKCMELKLHRSSPGGGAGGMGAAGAGAAAEGGGEGGGGGGGVSGYASNAAVVDESIQSITVASDASVLVGANSMGTCYVFKGRTNDSKSFTMVKEFQAHNAYLLKVVLSPNVRRLVTTSADSTAKVWSVGNDFELTRTLAQHQRWVWDAVFSADSSYLVTASSDHSAKLWELHGGDVIRNYLGHRNAVTCVALNDSSA